MNDGGDGFSFRSATDQGITETLQHSEELESREGDGGKQRCGFGVGDVINKGGGRRGGGKGNKIQKIMEAKALQTI